MTLTDLLITMACVSYTAITLVLGAAFYKTEWGKDGLCALAGVLWPITICILFGLALGEKFGAPHETDHQTKIGPTP